MVALGHCCARSERSGGGIDENDAQVRVTGHLPDIVLRDGFLEPAVVGTEGLPIAALLALAPRLGARPRRTLATDETAGVGQEVLEPGLLRLLVGVVLSFCGLESLLLTLEIGPLSFEGHLQLGRSRVTRRAVDRRVQNADLVRHRFEIHESGEIMLATESDEFLDLDDHFRLLVLEIGTNRKFPFEVQVISAKMSHVETTNKRVVPAPHPGRSGQDGSTPR